MPDHLLSQPEHDRPVWGQKATVSIYMEGEAASHVDWAKVVETLDLPPSVTFVGVAIATVQDEPTDQVAT